jgi:hypothetical protein
MLYAQVFKAQISVFSRENHNTSRSGVGWCRRYDRFSEGQKIQLECPVTPLPYTSFLSALKVSLLTLCIASKHKCTWIMANVRSPNRGILSQNDLMR